MRINTAKKGILATDMIDAADTAAMVATDVMVLGTTAVQTIGTAQSPAHGMPNWMGDVAWGGHGSINSFWVGGTDASETLYGTDLADDMYGEGGHDSLYGGLGNDRLFGGEGNDGLNGGAGADLLDGGAGNDTANYSGAAHGVTVDLVAGRGFGGWADGDTYVSIENVLGSSAGDVIIGSSGDNILNGGAGNDQIVGGAGRDTIIGGAGYDTLTGDDTGIMMADTFVFAPHEGGAYITDFQRGLDKIGIGAFGFDALGADGQLAWGDGDSHRSLGEGDRLYFDTRTNKLYVIDPFVGEDNVRLNVVEEVCTIGADLYRLQTEDLIFV
jgi:Ca2+-binding RTX toxin-like protein